MSNFAVGPELKASDKVWWALTPVLTSGNRFNRYSLLSIVVPVCYKTTEQGHLN